MNTKTRFSKILALITAVLMLIPSIAVTGFADTNSTSDAKQFTDVKGHWAENDINDWVAKGLVSGYEDNTFKPDNPVTRAEFVTFIDRSFKLTQTTDISFKDVKLSDWFYADIQKAKASNLIDGYNDNTVRPNNPITREEAAAIVVRLLKLQPSSQDVLKSFKDLSQISYWSRNSVNAAVANGLLAGYGDNTLGPTKQITRAETIVLLNRALIEQSKQTSAVSYDKAGTYGPETGTSTINSDVVVSAPDVILQNTIINGNLLIDKAVGNGNVTLKNVTINGTVTVNGGGEHSIVFDNCILAKVVVRKEDGKVRVVAQGSTKADSVSLQSGAKLEEDNTTDKGFSNVTIEGTLPAGTEIVLSGNFDNVKVNVPGVSVSVASGIVNNITVSDTAKDAKIDIAEGAKVSILEANVAVSVTGKGSIEIANINANGVTIEQKPANTNIASGVTATIGGQNVTVPSTGSTGSTGSGISGGSNNLSQNLLDFFDEGSPYIGVFGSNYIEFFINKPKFNGRIYSIAKLPNNTKPSIDELIKQSYGYDVIVKDRASVISKRNLNANTNYKIYYLVADTYGNPLSTIFELDAKTAPIEINSDLSISTMGLYSNFNVNINNTKNGIKYDNVKIQYDVWSNYNLPISTNDISLQYNDNGKWFDVPMYERTTYNEVYGTFGPTEGFTVSDNYNETTKFRVRVNKVNQYYVYIDLYDSSNYNSKLIGSYFGELDVQPMSFNCNGFDDFVAGEENQFSITAKTNNVTDDVYALYKATLTVADTTYGTTYDDTYGVPNQVIYYKVGDSWQPFTTDSGGVAYFGPASGFNINQIGLNDGITTIFKATIANPGNYKLQLELVNAETKQTLSTPTTIMFTVKTKQ